MNARVVCTLLLGALALSGCTAGPDAEPLPTGRIDGAVVDHFLRPWPQADVHLVELDRWTQTTDLGGFSFINVPPGFHTVEVTIPDVGTDRELVAVEDDISRTILQVFLLPPPAPYISQLAHRANVQVAEPGEQCDECRWSARLHDELPEAVVVKAIWDPVLAPGFETHLELEVWDEDHRRLWPPMTRSDEQSLPDGRTMLCAVIPAERLSPDSGRVVMEVRFASSNPVPHIDFDLETFMYIQYGDVSDPAHC